MRLILLLQLTCILVAWCNPGNDSDYNLLHIGRKLQSSNI